MEKPILAFIYKESSKYKVKNVGKGAAINILILHSVVRTQADWTTVTKCYSLGNNDEIELNWASGPDELVAIYFDVFNNIHISEMKDDQLSIISDVRKLKGIKSSILSGKVNVKILGKNIVAYRQIWS